jgi:hypothetical protein
MRGVWVPLVFLGVTPIFLALSHLWGKGLTSSSDWCGEASLGRVKALALVAVAQALLSVFLLFSAQWTFTVLLVTFAGLCVGAASAQQKRVNKALAWAALFVSLAVLGFNPIFGFSVNLVDAVAASQAGLGCQAYFPWEHISTLSLCKENGFLGFLRFLAVVIVAAQPFALILGYLAHIEDGSGGAAGVTASVGGGLPGGIPQQQHQQITQTQQRPQMPFVASSVPGDSYQAM